MSSWRYFGLFVVLAYGSYVGDAYAEDEEEIGKNYVAQEDVSTLLRDMESIDSSYGENWIIMPNGDGLPRLATMNTTHPLGKIILIPWTMEDVHKHVYFLYYNLENPDGIRFTMENLKDLPFYPDRPTKVLCHGWNSDSDAESVVSIKDEYLKSQKLNIIGVDWSFIANDPVYPKAAQATQNVGQYLAEHIDAIVETFGTNHADFHLIGHSLGAHVTGFAGNMTKNKVDRITGLDPALPCFQFISGPESRLDKSDANFVDIIHTCSGILGLSIPVGHIDFFPNGGSPFQPGCPAFIGATQSCSHSRSHKYFSESISSSEFIGVKCNGWEQFKDGDCSETFAVMGDKVPRDASGVYYLQTNPTSPFARGEEGALWSVQTLL